MGRAHSRGQKQSKSRTAAYARLRLVGVVEEAGPSVSEFKKGDEIYGVTNPQFCGANARLLSPMPTWWL